MKPEAETRKTLIDPQLRLAGWRLQDRSHVIEEYEIDLVEIGAAPMILGENPSLFYGKQFADYVLLRRNRIIAVIEAKATIKDVHLGREQARQYAQYIQQKQGGPAPFVIYTNGYDIYFWELGFYPPIKVHGFPTPDDLEWFEQRREDRRPLSAELINTEIAGRDYQIQAIRSVLELMESKRNRALLVMATGTGKTRTAMALIDVLQRSQWARRVLFLVDRIALRDQAIEAFREHLPGSPYWPKREGNNIETEWSSGRRLYCTTYPTMKGLIENGTGADSYISPFFFDLIIADESHRSIYNSYKSVLDWFAGVHIGLTATPRDQIGHDTFNLFDCDKELPTFAYTFEEAIRHDPPYLSNFEVLKVRSRFQLEGIRGEALPPEVQKKLISEGQEPEALDFEGTDLERKVTNSGTNALIVREFMEECVKDETGTLPGKSIFFAISQEHARRLELIFNELYPEHAGELATVIVSEDSRVHGKNGLLDQFKNKNFPRIAISVDMLDTGIDVPEVVNLVFAKPVYSYTKFWQMIGRGTRVLPDKPSKIKPWCRNKGKFLIIDCWGNFEYFKMNPKGKELGEDLPLPVKLFRARLDQLEAALGKGDEALAGIAKQFLQRDLSTLPANNAVVLAHAAELARVRDSQYWNNLTADDLGFLRTTVAPVLRSRSGIEPKAIRFETEVVELSTARAAGDTDRIALLSESLTKQASELPLQVNVIAAEAPAIHQARSPSWWMEASPEALAAISDRVAPLMRYRAAKGNGQVSLDLDDTTLIKEGIEFGPEHERLSTSAYRERIETALREMAENNATLRKIIAGETPTDDEIADLAALLGQQDPRIDPKLISRIYDVRSAELHRLLRHVLGLEQLPTWAAAVHKAFDNFIVQHNSLTEVQIRFLQTLRSFILQKRSVSRKDLVEAPFTQLHPNGIRGIFAGSTLQDLLQLTESLVA